MAIFVLHIATKRATGLNRDGRKRLSVTATQQSPTEGDRTEDGVLAVDLSPHLQCLRLSPSRRTSVAGCHDAQGVRADCSRTLISLRGELQIGLR